MADTATSPAAQRTAPWWPVLIAIALTSVVVAVVVPIALIAVLGGAAMIVATLRRPGVVLAMYLLLPFYKSAAQPYVPVDLTVLLAIFVSLQAVSLIRMRPPLTVPLAIFGLWAALEGLVLVGILYAPDPSLAVSRALNWTFLGAIPIGIGALRVGSDLRSIQHLLWTFFLFGSLVAVLGIVQLSSEERLVVFNTDTIAVARSALLVPLLAVVFILRYASRGPAWAAIALIPAAIIVALASGSRGPVVAATILVVVWGLVWVWRSRSSRDRLGPVVVGLVFGSMVVASLATENLPGESIDRFSDLGTFAQGLIAGESGAAAGDDSAAARLTLFGAALSMFAANPIVGAGTAGFEAVGDQYATVSAAAYPHNAVLQFAAEYGVVGVALFVAIVGLFMIVRLPKGGADAVRWVGLFFLLNAMVSGHVFEERTMWGLILVALVASATVRPHVTRDETPAIDASATTTILEGAPAT